MDKYNHVEAFCLMIYATDDRTESEILWNSRDGVTPFVIRSRTGREMSHVDWKKDVCSPDHKPADEQRVFVTATKDLALPKAVKYVDLWWNHEEVPMSKHDFFKTMGKEKAAEHFVENWCKDSGPWIVTGKEYASRLVKT